MSLKQVIIVRKDLNINRGKQIAQACHASMAFLLDNIWDDGKKIHLSVKQLAWAFGGQAKICCQVSSEEELLDVYNKAKAAKLEVHLITDSGKTYFDGVPTKTCLAIGPADSDEIDPITGHLKLY